MTDKEQYELIGKVVSEYTRIEKELNMLRIKVREIGKTMVSIGNQLKESPELLVFSGETTDMTFFGRTNQIKKEDLANLDTIISLRDQIRNNITELEKLAQQKKDLGIP